MKKILKNILCLIIFFIGMLVNYSFAETTSANIPVVVSGLTPIKFDSGSWVQNTDGYLDSDWYDYENGLWANAEMNNGDKYVWIPRFTYKIAGETISIKWSDGKIDDTSDGYLRHPAFYFGEYIGGDTLDNANFIERNGSRNELTGFWIKKELFTDNVTNVSDAIESAIKMTQDTAYGLPQSGAYTHMTKASEWGALAYLTKAKGKLTNKRTTLNQTGVILGDVSEYVAGLKGNPNVNIDDIFISNYKKYRDRLDNDLDSYFGYALSELSSSGELDLDSYLVRGGDLGLFEYISGSGTDTGKGYRTSISIITEELTDAVAFFDTEASVVAGDYLILGVDFYVQEEWKFPASPSEFFTPLSSIEDKKIIDMECIYEGAGTWKQTDLNAQVIKMIDKDFNLFTADNISENTVYPAGKYTLMVRIGGKDGEDNFVFRPMENMDAKIVVNQLNLKNTAGDIIKIDRIPNNKVRLNIYGESASNVITSVVLISAPTKTEYDLDEELNLSGGIIVPYLGTLAGEEMSITIENVVNPNITSIPGEHQVELTYNGIPVTQDSIKFIITVSDTRQLVVKGEVKVGTSTINSSFKGPGKYSRGDFDAEKDLVASEYLNAYMFNKWTSSSQNVKAKDSTNFNTTFTVPKKSTTIDSDEVTITAHYIKPSGLEVRNPKTEFTAGDDFSIGEGKIIVTYEKDGGTKVEREISIGTSGVTVTIKDENGNEIDLDKLPEGVYNVTIGFGDEIVKYEIEVVKGKRGLNIYIPSADCGEISGTIKDSKGNIKDTIEIKDDITSVYKYVPAGRTVTLTATAKGEYSFSGWKITGGENLVLEENLSNAEITFIMPESDITIEAEFKKSYNVTFKVKAGQESMGTLSGETTQTVLLGESTSPVTAVANDGYAFVRWVDSDNRLISQDEKLISTYVTENREYIAIFASLWTVKFYNDDTLFKTIEVRNGESGYITETPQKYAYVFTGWDKDLSSVTSDIVTYAEYVPRIDIEENTTPEVNTIDAQITGTMIADGSLEYIITSSPEIPEDHYYTYQLDGIFTGVEGNWYNLEDVYRNSLVDSGEDSSSILTISSSASKETVSFEYVLSATSDSQLGITINGEKVIGPTEDMSGNEWKSFKKQVDVVDGAIKIGISYSQGDGDNVSGDFAALRNIAVSREWTAIPNSYHLLTPVEYAENYVHVKGIGSDDSVLYRAVSDVFISEGTILDTYTVTFNANGGLGSVAPQTFTEGIAQELTANVFTKEGYIFMGWSTVPNSAVEYANKASYIATEDTVLYAVWKEIIYGDANDDGVVDQLDVTRIQRYLSDNTTQINFVNADVALDGKIDICDMYILVDSGYGGTYSLPYTDKLVVFMKNSSGSGMSVQKFATGETKTLELNSFENEGYTFAGWSTTEAGEVVYGDGAEYTATANIILYAVWGAEASKTYTVTFNANDGSGSMEAQTFPEGVAQELTANAFTKEGYIFMGWSTVPNSAVEYANKASYIATGDTVLYAVWKEIIYGDANDDGVVDQLDVTRIQRYLSDNTTQINFVNADVALDGKIDICDMYILSDSGYGSTYNLPYTDKLVVFMENSSGSGMSVQKFATDETKTLELNSFENEGYTFAGWSTTEAGEVVYIDGAEYTATANITLYAVWTMDTYTIRFRANGGTGTMDSLIVIQGKSCTLPACSFSGPNSKSFSGWATSANGNVVYSNKCTFTPTSNMTLYAKWADITITDPDPGVSDI